MPDKKPMGKPMAKGKPTSKATENKPGSVKAKPSSTANPKR